MRRAIVFMSALVALVALSRAAHADGRSSSSVVSLPWGTIVWDDETGACGDAKPVAAIVEANIDATVKRAPIFVRGEVTSARAQRLRASLFLRRGGSWASREVDAEGCEPLRRAAAAVVALAYELGLDEHDEPATAGPETSPPASASAVAGSPAVDGALDAARAPAPSVHSALASSETSSPSTRGRSAENLTWTAWLASALDTGTLPSIAAGVRLAIGLESRRWVASLGGFVLPAVSQTIRDRTEGVTVGAAAAAASGCLRFSVSERADILPCAGGSFGRYWASGFGTTSAQSTGATYVAVDGALDGVYAFGRTLRLRASIGGAWLASRPTFYVEGVGDVHRPSAVVFRAAIGPELAF